MRSQKEKSLLDYLIGECEMNKFSVVEKKDMLSSFGKKIYVEENELEHLVASLERQGYIKVKYDDDNVYCLSVLKEEEGIKKESKKSSFLPLLLIVLAGSFVGSMLGTILIKILFY